MRKMFQLSEEDRECLAECGREWEAVIETKANEKTNWLILPGCTIPEGYNVSTGRVALKIPPKYPDEQIDMAYFDPPLQLKSGKGIPNLTLLKIEDRDFQQWSRHRTGANPWRPGIDNICTHLLQVESWLRKELSR